MVIDGWIYESAGSDNTGDVFLVQSATGSADYTLTLHVLNTGTNAYMTVAVVSTGGDGSFDLSIDGVTETFTVGSSGVDIESSNMGGPYNCATNMVSAINTRFGGGYSSVDGSNVVTIGSGTSGSSSTIAFDDSGMTGSNPFGTPTINSPGTDPS